MRGSWGREITLCDQIGGSFIGYPSFGILSSHLLGALDRRLGSDVGTATQIVRRNASGSTTTVLRPCYERELRLRRRHRSDSVSSCRHPQDARGVLKSSSTSDKKCLALGLRAAATKGSALFSNVYLLPNVLLSNFSKQLRNCHIAGLRGVCEPRDQHALARR